MKIATISYSITNLTMMKKILLSCLVFSLLLTANLQAQSPELKNGITFKRLFVDYHTPVLEELAEVDLYTGGIEIGYLRNLNKFLNLNVPAKVRSVTLPNDAGNFSSREVAAGLDAILQLQYFEAKNWINPYLMAGVGGEYISGNDANFALPLGVGLNIRLGQQFYVQLQSEYRLGFTDNRDNLIHGIGFMVPFGKPAPPPPPDADGDGITDLDDLCPLEAGTAAMGGCPDQDNDGIADKDDECPTEAGPKPLKGCPDGDNDGIPNKDDACPDVAGMVKFDGCPDSDNDGIQDSDDQCPTEAGPASNNGCPYADTDNDGVIDKDDQCPNEPGTAANDGCPDLDGDGIIDKKDRCPDKAGPASNRGCPEITKEDKEVLEFAVQNVNFKSASASLTAASLGVLDQVADIMLRYPDYNLAIGGHTDSIGNLTTNLNLSKKRAKACYDYLISKGVTPNRMSHEGYGETQPIANNKYRDGRDQNRRVEFNIFLK